MSHDRISVHHRVRLNLHLPHIDGGQARYAMLDLRTKRGVPTGTILLDGVLNNVPADPPLEVLLECFDSALARHRLY